MSFKTIYKLIISRLNKKRTYIHKENDCPMNHTDKELEFRDIPKNLGLEDDEMVINGIMDRYGLHILENYVSFMEIVNYLSIPLNDREQNLPFLN
jgi:hypothetical protein